MHTGTNCKDLISGSEYAKGREESHIEKCTAVSFKERAV